MCRLQQKQEAILLHICGQQMQPYSHMSPAQGKQLTEPKWQTNNPTQISQTETKKQKLSKLMKKSISIHIGQGLGTVIDWPFICLSPTCIISL